MCFLAINGRQYKYTASGISSKGMCQIGGSWGSWPRGALPMGFVRFARINSRKGDTFLMNVDRENLMDFFRHLTWKVHFDTKKNRYNLTKCSRPSDIKK